MQVKKTSLLVSTILILSILGFFAIDGINTYQKNLEIAEEIDYIESGKFKKDLPQSSSEGRAEYDWLRLHDPVTQGIPRGIRSLEVAYAKTLPKRDNMLDSQEWDFRGPFNVGGRTRALAVDVTNSQRVLAGGVTGGMWLSNDGAETWSRTTDLSVTPSVTCLSQDTRDGMTDTWYYGTGEYRGSSSRSINSRRPQYTGEGIFKSEDGGLTWNQIPSTVTPINDFGSPFDVVYGIAINPTNTEQDEIWAATYGCIQRSLDGGATWEIVLGEFEFVEQAYTEVIITPLGVIYASLASDINDGGIWRSEDHGVSWENITPQNFPQNYRRVVMAYAPSDETNLFFLAYTPNEGFNSHSIWHLIYINALAIWENRSDNMPNFNDTQSISGLTYNSQQCYNMCVAFHPDDLNMVYIGGTVLYRSSDGFATNTNTDWIGGYNYYLYNLPGPEGNDVSYPQHHADVHFILFDPNDSGVLYSTHDGGLSKSTDPLFVPGDQTPFPWNRAVGYITTQFYWVAVDPLNDGDLKLSGGMQDNGTWAAFNEDTNWFDLFGGDGMACDIGPGTNGLTSYYCSTQYGGSFYKVLFDENDEFVTYERFEPDNSDLSRWITPFELTPYDYSGMVMVGTNTVYVNDDIINEAQDGWSEIAGSGHGNRWTTALGISSDQDPVVYYGDFDVDMNNPGISGLYRIDNTFTNPTITEVTGDSFVNGGWIHCIAVDPTDADKAIVVFTNYNVQSLFYTDDGGQSWTTIGGNLEENPDGTGSGPSCYWAEIVYPDNSNGEPVYFAGTTAGLFSTTTLAGLNTVWTLEAPDQVGYNWVTSMDVRRSDNYLAIGTHGGGCYSSFVTYPDVSVDPLLSVTPSEFAIENIYPNPFNPTTNVNIRLPQKSELTVVVFNSLGREVTSLASGSFDAGSHSFVFDGSKLSSGVYYIHMTAGDVRDVKRMVLTK
jgi:Secretion system C-terminal sorting domain